MEMKFGKFSSFHIFGKIFLQYLKTIFILHLWVKVQNVMVTQISQGTFNHTFRLHGAYLWNYLSLFSPPSLPIAQIHKHTHSHTGARVHANKMPPMQRAIKACIF